MQRPGGRGLGGRVQSGDDLSVACGDSSPSQGEPRGVRRSQCLPLLRGGAERSEAERFRRAAAAGATSQALRRQLPFARGAKGGDSVGAGWCVANATAADILAYLAVKGKKFYWNLTFFDFSWYMSHGV